MLLLLVILVSFFLAGTKTYLNYVEYNRRLKYYAQAEISEKKILDSILNGSSFVFHGAKQSSIEHHNRMLEFFRTMNIKYANAVKRPWYNVPADPSWPE